MNIDYGFTPIEETLAKEELWRKLIILKSHKFE